MSAKIRVSACIAVCMGVLATAQEFHEGWETAQITDHVPSAESYISADEGFWFLGDAVSQFPTCGQTRNEAQILVSGGSKALRLLSNRSFTTCGDDIWVFLAQFDSLNRGFGIPLTPGTTISFTETGELEDPQLHNGGANCIMPPCFDNVSLILTDNNGNILAYVLQRYPAAVENNPNTNYGDVYREIFLDPEAGRYRRNLFDDFQRIRTFDPDGAEIRSVEFRVDEHGWGIVDDITIDSGGPAAAVPVHRFWSPVLANHFYTASESERELLVNTYPGVWTYEGVAFRGLPENGDPNLLPVYRFWSPALLSHFYTIDEIERDLLTEEFPDIWVPEGVAFYAFAEDARPEDTRPVYRFWSPVLIGHFYTIDEAEKDLLIRDYPGIWTPEGVAWYAYPP